MASDTRAKEKALSITGGPLKFVRYWLTKPLTTSLWRS
ncbi:hypothetical protein YSA_09215 [Pseudomonas putida ND6]|uniref:Uncharacterized protein n=1 Tax=Pseudomonas putida ND6 TaxID=231023 RepID=I3V1Y2_PSEPU|nr:hypothetical protein YSA_09215 [Pseudomonas putida ND6]